MTAPSKSATLVGIGIVVGTVGASTWLRAQETDGRRQAVAQILPETSQQQPGRIYSGDDIGFRVERMRGDTPVAVPVVKVNGEWVDLEFGGGGIRKLTK